MHALPRLSLTLAYCVSMKLLNKTVLAASISILASCGGGGGGSESGSSIEKTDSLNVVDNSTGSGHTTSNSPSSENPSSAGSLPAGNAAGSSTSGLGVPASSSSINIPRTYPDAQRNQIFDIINTYRVSCGFSPVKQSLLLDKAAQGHANYLRVNNSSGHDQAPNTPNFTGTSPSARIDAAGYQFSSSGEIVATGSSWFQGADNSNWLNSRLVGSAGSFLIKSLFTTVYHLSSAVGDWQDVGVGFSQALSPDLTTTPTSYTSFSATAINFANPASASASLASSEVLSFPCNGLTGIMPIFGPESPSPYPKRDFINSPMGTPILLKSPKGAPIAIASAQVYALADKVPLKLEIMVANNDPHSLVSTNEAFIIPDQPLKANTQYQVNIQGTTGSTPFTKKFSFQTGS